METEVVEFSNILMTEFDSIDFNEWAQFKRKESGNETVLTYSYPTNITVESTASFIKYAMMLTFPEIHIYPESNQTHGSFHKDLIIDYYSDTTTIITEYSVANFTTEKVNLLRKNWNMICTHMRESNRLEDQGNIEYRFTPWFTVLNNYTSACTTTTIADGIVNLIICLEAMVTNNEKNIKNIVSTRVSVIYSSDYTIRKKTYQLIKDMYEIRSLIVHGDNDSLLKTKYNWYFEDAYKYYFTLKQIVSKLFLELDGLDKDTVINKIQSCIFEAQMNCTLIDN